MKNNIFLVRNFNDNLSVNIKKLSMKINILLNNDLLNCKTDIYDFYELC